MRSVMETDKTGEGRPQPLDLTIVAHDLGAVGGMERQLAELVLGLRRKGHRVTVIGRTCVLPPDAGVTFHRVRAPARPFVLAYPWFLIAGTLAVRRHRRGLVQATGAIVLNKVDVIAVHYCHQVGPANASRSTRLFRGHVRVAAVLKRLGERLCFAVGRPQALVCVSEGVAEEVRENYPALSERVTTIQNGVDTDAFRPGARRDDARARRDELGLGASGLLAGFVGSEWERKGLEPLIRALPGSDGWSLLVAGGGERERYAALADELGVGERVVWLGVSSDVALVYAMIDAFVLPTSYETFSLVTFEAAACALPILVTPVNGVRELIEDGRNGYLIDRDPGVIAARLRTLGGDPALRSELGQAARASALEFSSQRMVDRHESLYAQLARRRREGARRAEA